MKSLKNDANFLIGKASYTTCEDILAKNFLANYLSNLDRGMKKSIYSKEDALLYLKKMD